MRRKLGPVQRDVLASLKSQHARTRGDRQDHGEETVSAPRCKCGCRSVYPIDHAKTCPYYLHYFDPPGPNQ